MLEPSNTPSQGQHLSINMYLRWQQVKVRRKRLKGNAGEQLAQTVTARSKRCLLPRARVETSKDIIFPKKFFGRCHNVNETDKKFPTNFRVGQIFRTHLRAKAATTAIMKTVMTMPKEKR